MARKLSKMHQRVLDAKKHNQDGVIDELVEKTGDASLKELKKLKGLKMPKEKFWDNASSCYHSIKEQVTELYDQTCEHLAALVSTPEGHARWNGDERLNILTKSFLGDYANMMKRLDAVYETHKQHTGTVKDPDEMMKVMMVSGEYSDISEAYLTLMRTTVTEIMDYTGELEAAAEEIRESLKDQSPLTPQQDPSIITDVEVKEITN